MPAPKVDVVADLQELGRAAARQLARFLLKKPNAVMALPTGRTPEPLYAELVHLYRAGLLDFSQVHILQLDEVHGLPPGHPRSFQAHLTQHLIAHVNVSPERFYTLPSQLDDPNEACAAYERQIEALGGLDLVVLGIGTNGHLAFNEPGTPFHRDTHLTELTPETREALRETFGIEPPPDQALTMGLRTIMRARCVLLLAAGKKKAPAVANALQGSITPEVPASVLQLHPSLHVILDASAATQLVDTATSLQQTGPAVRPH